MATLERIKAQYEEHLKTNWSTSGIRLAGSPLVRSVLNKGLDELRASISQYRYTGEREPGERDAIAMSFPHYELMLEVERQMRNGMSPVAAVDSVLGPMRPIPFTTTKNDD